METLMKFCIVVVSIASITNLYFKEYITALAFALVILWMFAALAWRDMYYNLDEDIRDCLEGEDI